MTTHVRPRVLFILMIREVQLVYIAEESTNLAFFVHSTAAAVL